MRQSGLNHATVSTAWEPVLIVGVGRSGTSLLQSMLASHSMLSFAPETSFIRRYLAASRLSKRLRRRGVNAVLTELESDRRIARLGLDFGEMLSELTEQRHEVFEENLYRTMHQRFAADQGKPRVGDKEPKAIEHLPLIQRFWPQAYVVHIIRDPRDVIASKRKASWSNRRPSFVDIMASAAQFKLGRTLGPRLFGDRYIELFYEDLLGDCEQVVKKLCRQLRLQYEPQMLSFAAAAEQLVSAEEMSWKKETLGPLLDGNAGKWRESLRNWEVALTEDVCRETLQAGCYAPSGMKTTMPPAARAALWIAGQGLHGVAAMYQAFRMRQARRNQQHTLKLADSRAAA